MSHSFTCASIIVLAIVVLLSVNAVSAERGSKSWNLLRKRAIGNFVNEADKQIVDSNLVQTGRTNTSTGAIIGGSVTSDGELSLRQYGSSNYGSSGYGGGSYDIYTLLAVSAFAALFGALFFELATGGTLRSMGASSLQLPMGINLDYEQLPQLVSTITDWITNSAWIENISRVKSRTLREVGGQVGISKWIQAYKKDPIEYQCIRKIACETLAKSSLVERSMKSQFGSIFLGIVGNFIENGEELQGIVNDAAGNPEKCVNFAPWGFCEDYDDDHKD